MHPATPFPFLLCSIGYVGARYPSAPLWLFGASKGFDPLFASLCSGGAKLKFSFTLSFYPPTFLVGALHKFVISS
jgi:hypothetical protein